MEIIDPGVMYTHLIATSLRGNSFYLFFLNFALRPLIAHVIDAPPVHSQMSLFKQVVIIVGASSTAIITFQYSRVFLCAVIVLSNKHRSVSECAGLHRHRNRGSQYCVSLPLITDSDYYHFISFSISC